MAVLYLALAAGTFRARVRRSRIQETPAKKIGVQGGNDFVDATSFFLL